MSPTELFSQGNRTNCERERLEGQRRDWRVAEWQQVIISRNKGKKAYLRT